MFRVGARRFCRGKRGDWVFIGMGFESGPRCRMGLHLGVTLVWT